MPTLDSGAVAALGQPAFAAAFFVWVDIVGDPLRITTFGKDVTVPYSGDPDLNYQTFLSFDPRAIQIGDVTNAEGGSETLNVDLSGIPSIPADMMDEIVDVTKWRGRTVRLWFQLYDETGVSPQGAVVAYYTGYASSVRVLPSAKTQIIRLEVENYLAAFNQASNRSYLNQKDYDSTDNSASATLAAANMGRGVATTGGQPPGDYGGISGGSGGGGYSLSSEQRYQ